MSNLEFGLQIAVVGIGAVFIGLMLVFIFLVALRRYVEQPQRIAAADSDKPPFITEEVTHAIALALYMDLRTFERDEPAEITIQKVTRSYSPWWNAGKVEVMDEYSHVFRRPRQ